MPTPRPASPTASTVAESSNREPNEAPDDPDQPRRGIFARVSDRIFPRTALIRFLGYVRPHLWLVAGGSAMGILKFTMPLAFPLAFKYVFDVLLVPQPRIEKVDALIDRLCVSLASTLHLGAGSAAKLEALTAALFVLFFVQAIATYFRNYWASMAGHRLIFDLRYALFLHMQRLSHSFFDRTTSGAVVSRFISDISMAQNFVGSAMINIWMDGVSLGFVVWLLFYLNTRLAWISLIVIPFYVAVIRILSPKIKETSHDLQEVVEEFSGELQERVAGISTVKSFAREAAEARRFHQRTTQLYDLTIDSVRLSATHQMFTEFISRSAPLLVIWAGALMIMHGKMTIGTVVAFFAFLGALYLPLQRFSELSVIVATSLAAIERIFQFFDETPEVTDLAGAPALPVPHGCVEIEHLGFGYKPLDGGPRRMVLHDVNLAVAAGTTVALVGRSGAGKTTLASLIPRFYELTAGRILIDGTDISAVTLKSLRDSIGIVPQDAILFSASIRENVQYGRPGASDGDVWRALEQANIRDFIESLSNKLDTTIGEGSVRPSTGQRQRLALARVFLKNPPILILDEATSGLDSEVENLIHDAVRRLMKGRTSFLIAHRLASAVDADVIVVLDRGRVVEVGAHAELVKRSGVYAQLFNEQTRKLRLTPEHTSRLPGSLRLARVPDREPAA
ncbi:MAG: ABC transporter ATP-binding protein [Candidatus Binatus sp.]|uniref:ABC transporter ATP-binding protein n=1 Tax=Candidatus Binatus sp. TaxID=2811406 RepID=UPI00271638C0|nr:ABC transporter ATP-binding protein [Candidatus Binatus sp.]MDO8431108.1 ABC transporter ATP-binding protein [Candidatus Binatus sp.]